MIGTGKMAMAIPEGSNILPDGSWHRIGDLSNGANQGITLHALELCAGIDVGFVNLEVTED